MTLTPSTSDEYAYITLDEGHGIDLKDIRDNSGFTFDIIGPNVIEIADDFEAEQLFEYLNL